MHPQLNQINQLISNQLNDLKNKISNLEFDKEKFKYDINSNINLSYLVNDSNESKYICVINCGEQNIEFENYLDAKLKSLFSINIKTYTE